MNYPYNIEFPLQFSRLKIKAKDNPLTPFSKGDSGGCHAPFTHTRELL